MAFCGRHLKTRAMTSCLAWQRQQDSAERRRKMGAVTRSVLSAVIAKFRHVPGVPAAGIVDGLVPVAQLFRVRFLRRRQNPITSSRSRRATN